MLRLTAANVSKRFLIPSASTSTTSIMSRKSSTKAAVQDPPPGYAIDPKAPPMLRYQASLPNLPVPTLESTAAKYLETVQPLLTPAEFSETRAAVDSFLQSPLSKELQKRLQARASENESWLSEWWNEAAYMGYRDPVVVFVSYFFVHIDDKLRKDQASRAASLVKAMLPFRDMVESGRLEPEKVRGNPLCMASYKWLFHSSRYPVKPSDKAAKFDAKENNHIVVLRKNRFFVVPLTNKSGQEVSYAELEAQFNKIKQLAGDNAASVPVGALTSDHRDLWADNRAKLLAASSKNASLLQKIESAMIVVVLDDVAPVTRDQVSWHTWTGNARNRFFDKHQIVIYENGKSAFLGEHSCMDGTPTLRMNEFILASIDKGKIDLTPKLYEQVIDNVAAPEELVFETNKEVEEAVNGALERYERLIGGHDLQVLHYEGYGKELMKQFKLSPDAWAQLVKQLAFHKMYKRPGVCYESCQTRKFKLGRTEVIRTVSNESKKWVEAMEDPSVTDPTYLRTLFQTAVSRHIQYAGWAADGQGVDRHLFGLKKLLKEGEQVPAIYTDKAFSKSNHWELSTSQLSSKYFDGWGYGEVVPDGFGLSYSIGDNYVRWCVTSCEDEGVWDTEGKDEALRRRKVENGKARERNALMKHYLAEAATQVREMLEAAAKVDKAKAEKAKL
ncbi:carnitine acetyl transferase [Coprinopsis cinerea okayama7|uniref:Carnitine O-acetyltransferase, mitochondrial n=1 Tax=Coprinopsis cinerea (strain Okayama-7 / 130 / ATCC MYA-4618 / FGSC 9003) TaxID=240176 RepID=A8NSK8_COPC7|nr:carnitine acetyl transferase [Coprinopsis cinerea okayama7\|eukprot:XP_001836034.1 carnitine acetyl transferase [Coprinopsis cinerea okayama7\